MYYYQSVSPDSPVPVVVIVTTHHLLGAGSSSACCRYSWRPWHGRGPWTRYRGSRGLGSDTLLFSFILAHPVSPEHLTWSDGKVMDFTSKHLSSNY